MTVVRHVFYGLFGTQKTMVTIISKFDPRKGQFQVIKSLHYEWRQKTWKMWCCKTFGKPCRSTVCLVGYFFCNGSNLMDFNGSVFRICGAGAAGAGTFCPEPELEPEPLTRAELGSPANLRWLETNIAPGGGGTNIAPPLSKAINEGIPKAILKFS